MNQIIRTLSGGMSLEGPHSSQVSQYCRSAHLWSCTGGVEAGGAEGPGLCQPHSEFKVSYMKSCLKKVCACSYVPVCVCKNLLPRLLYLLLLFIHLLVRTEGGKDPLHGGWECHLGATTMEITMEVPPNTRKRSTTWPSYTVPGYVPKGP